MGRERVHKPFGYRYCALDGEPWKDGNTIKEYLDIQFATVIGNCACFYGELRVL